MTEAIIAAVLVLGGIVKSAQMLGWISEGSTTKHFRDKLEAEQEITRELRAENITLRQTRSLEPVLEQLARNSEIQTQTLDKLTSLNGGLAKVEEGLASTVEALKSVAGMVASEQASVKRRTRKAA